VIRRTSLLATIVCLPLAACAPRLATLPAGAGAPFPDYLAAYEQATAACRTVRTMAAVLSISGRAGSQRFRARLDGGFEAPARVRLEFPAPGRPLFTYVAVGDQATLLLPREGRVLVDAPPAATLEALAGVSIGPEDLRTIVAGCGFAASDLVRGRAFDRGWLAIDAGSDTIWLQQVGAEWRMAAALRGSIDVRYADFASGRPATIRLRAAPAGESHLTDLTIRLSQVDINEPLASAVFEVEVAPDATRMTLAELREAGPLGR
jgi:hypothetical protein